MGGEFVGVEQSSGNAARCGAAAGRSGSGRHGQAGGRINRGRAAAGDDGYLRHLHGASGQVNADINLGRAELSVGDLEFIQNRLGLFGRVKDMQRSSGRFGVNKLFTRLGFGVVLVHRHAVHAMDRGCGRYGGAAEQHEDGQGKGNCFHDIKSAR